MVVHVALREAHAVRRLATGDDDLLDAQLARRFDHVVRAEHIPLEALVVWHEHVSGVCSEVNHRVDLFDMGSFVAGHVEMRAEGIEDLAAVCEISLEGVDIWVRERDKIQIEDLVPLVEKVGNNMAASFAGTASEYDSFATTSHLKMIEVPISFRDVPSILSSMYISSWSLIFEVGSLS